MQELRGAAAAGPPVTPVLTGAGQRATGTASQALSSVARAAIEVLAGDLAASPMKECGRPDCTRVYLDRSRGHRRTWCGMEECGNRVKAAAYRRRLKERAGE
ncbi:CGNR zinc finger domain-containing protein [Promicromonospora thailandica]|uniref:CGNR zinc finger domain-containing protein n=1 Tax=Promicromonospora thailandica TaxID=765201 RepID=A0A9X2JWY5_9MICO|nr:CGNR zinc finger domain-containing protein [Promicromonospora thailandica]MCP2265638.1 CGNR zinc finger domain-containing protein [Promicromonospora thailandica]BFF21644.1 hypothetical protein GCM10025730_51650 [Promicromonospora thailandica]